MWVKLYRQKLSFHEGLNEFMNDRLHMQPRVGCLNIDNCTAYIYIYIFFLVRCRFVIWYLVSEVGFYFLVLVCVCVRACVRACLRVRSLAYSCFSPGRNCFQGTFDMF